MSFETAVGFTLLWEGGHSNDPADPGGETNFGISARANPGVDITNLTESQAKAIYFRKYWKPNKLDKMAPSLACAMFDFGVNCGVKVAAQSLQSELRGLNVDGRIGPKTLARLALTQLTWDELAYRITMRRVRFYTKLIARRPRNIRFLHGWMRRTHAIVRLTTAGLGGSED